MSTPGSVLVSGDEHVKKDKNVPATTSEKTADTENAGIRRTKRKTGRTRALASNEVDPILWTTERGN